MLAGAAVSSGGWTEAGRSTCNSLTRLTSYCWQLAGNFSSSPQGCLSLLMTWWLASSTGNLPGFLAKGNAVIT